MLAYKELLEKHPGKGTLMVLKGYPIDQETQIQPSLDAVMDNMIGRLMDLTQQDYPIMLYGEFVCLYDLLVKQFKTILLIENPVYHVFYPVYEGLSETVIQSLLSHFDEEAGDATPMGAIEPFTDIYSNFIETDSGYACCFNIDHMALMHPSIKKESIALDLKPLKTVPAALKTNQEWTICQDLDYFLLVQRLHITEDKITVSYDSYQGDQSLMTQLLEVLNSLYENRLWWAGYTPLEKEKQVHPDMMAMMQTYWGFDQFRLVKVYDLQAIKEKGKKILAVSQGNIIQDLVDQAERCVEGKGFRDVFVTAPTGSGKSLMFQLPAMYLAKHYNLVTLVITPLIGLMNDQVQALAAKGYPYARTINSDVSPIIREEILEEVSQGKCHILYLSPESLLSRSDINQLIGDRKIGMMIIDEAHIVTTWGKQFRPDYWYLGGHVQKIRKNQAKRDNDPAPFIIATFTATAIYEGEEDMYHETINSLHMIDPITYLGYTRRENIDIEVSEVAVKKNKTEYEINKFDALIEMIHKALMRSQKTLIYFPTVALINRFYDYCYSKNLDNYVAKYHGQMDGGDKDESFKDFQTGKKLVMVATKAFGMGIDIPDIAIVSHFAPTGNVCDYMQEIGRAARDSSIDGHALYQHMSNDFKHINRLHGLSAIQKYQLVEVIKKILELYVGSRYKDSNPSMTKRRNEMLVDSESFAYIFEGPLSDSDDLTNKVKTAMLLIQKDYENRGFSPFYMRPIPLFAYGYFSLSREDQERLKSKYPGVITLRCPEKHICEIHLKGIWEKDYCHKMSFPKFKFLLYSNHQDLQLCQHYRFKSAMKIDVLIYEAGYSQYQTIISALKALMHQSVLQSNYLSLEVMAQTLSDQLKISKFRIETILGVVLAAIELYQKAFSPRLNTKLYKIRVTKNNKVTYQFLPSVSEFFSWLDRGYKDISENLKEESLYVVDGPKENSCKAITTILGVLESAGALRFKSLGGTNSQLYIYVNETKNMQMVKDKPHTYKNRLLEMINQRHKTSVAMLTYLFQSGFSSETIWNHLENYFLGILPEDFQSIDS